MQAIFLICIYKCKKKNHTNKTINNQNHVTIYFFSQVSYFWGFSGKTLVCEKRNTPNHKRHMIFNYCRTRYFSAHHIFAYCQFWTFRASYCRILALIPLLTFVHNLFLCILFHDFLWNREIRQNKMHAKISYPTVLVPGV